MTTKTFLFYAASATDKLDSSIAQKNIAISSAVSSLRNGCKTLHYLPIMSAEFYLFLGFKRIES